MITLRLLTRPIKTSPPCKLLFCYLVRDTNMERKNQQCSGFSSSAESLAFRELYQDILTVIMYNTEPLAVKLYSKDVISSSVRDKVLLQTLTPDIKASELLSAVEAEVKVNPKQFMIFVSTLRELGEPASFIVCADRLMKAKETRLKSTTSQAEPPEHTLNPPLSPPQRIKINVSNYKLLQEIKTISKERLLLPSHKQLKLNDEEQFSPQLTIQDTETCQPFNCTILLPDESLPPIQTVSTLLCRLYITVEVHPFFRMRPVPKLYHMQRNGPLVQNSASVELQFCFIQAYSDYVISFSVASIIDNEGIEYIGYSCEKCQCVVQAVDQHANSILSMPHVFTQYKVPCQKALYRKFDETFNNLLYSGSHTAKVDQLVSTITSNQNLSPDIKIEALCFQASERQLRYLPWESLSILDRALVLADQPSCMNSQLLKGRIFACCTSALRMQHHYDDALKHIQQAKCMYFSAAPSGDTSNVFYEEAILREFLSDHNKDRSGREHLYFMAIEHARFGSQLEDDHDLCVMHISKAVYHLKSVYISKLKPPISEDDLFQLQPTLDDLSKAEESLRVAEVDIHEMNPFTKGNYYRAMSDLHLWRKDYQKATQYAELAKQQYTLEHLDSLVSYIEARLPLLTKLAKQQTDAELELEKMLEECLLTDEETC